MLITGICVSITRKTTMDTEKLQERSKDLLKRRTTKKEVEAKAKQETSSVAFQTLTDR